MMRLMLLVLLSGGCSGAGQSTQPRYSSQCEHDKLQVEADFFEEAFTACQRYDTPEDCPHFEPIQRKYQPRRDAVERACRK